MYNFMGRMLKKSNQLHKSKLKIMKRKIVSFILFFFITSSVYSQTEDISFPYPSIPSELKSLEERATYLAAHYWDLFDFSKSNIKELAYVEQAWVNFVDFLKLVSDTDAQKAIKSTFQKAEPCEDTLKYFMELAQKYLYTTDSPLKNEEYYRSALEVILSSSTLSDIDKVKPQHQLTVIQKNRIGTQVPDIFYQTSKGKKGTLHQIETTYTLLFIHDFDCHTCQMELDELRESSLLKELIQNKQLTILTLYPYENIQEWKNHQDSYDTGWINGFDATQELLEKEAYILRSSSSFYLLDTDKKVILKDTNIKAVEKQLN